MNVGKTLRSSRKMKGLKQKDLATEYIDRSAYSRIENQTRDVRLGDLEEILQKLSINIEEFSFLAQLDYDQTKFRE